MEILANAFSTLADNCVTCLQQLHDDIEQLPLSVPSEQDPHESITEHDQALQSNPKNHSKPTRQFQVYDKYDFYASNTSQLSVLTPKVSRCPINKNNQRKFRNFSTKSKSNQYRAANRKMITTQPNQSTQSGAIKPHRNKILNLQPNKPINFTQQQLFEKQMQKQHHHNKISQLRYMYQRKNKLRKKLEKLNTELQQLKTQSEKKYDRFVQQISPGERSKTNFKGRNRYNHSLHVMSSVKSSRRVETEVEKSQKAIEFTERMSKDSFQRRLKYKHKLNKLLSSRVINHVSLNCSRAKCTAEAIEGEFHQEVS